MFKYLPITALLFPCFAFATSFDGCYAHQEAITDVVSGSHEKKISYVKISRNESDYLVRGVLWGGNFHICYIQSTEEGTDNPLSMSRVGDSLIYTESDPEYDIYCKLEMKLKGDVLHIEDANFDCNRIFSCGARVGLNNTDLKKSPGMCSESPDISED
ncbi:hypothetical protein OAP63_12285 [Vibrio sp.]|uniref:DUF3757 domain-containing protein n=1 Tax=Vibrio viridaestus TaxID=2487322 RepID=A0A3N9TFX1_9VIBR|nr:hypothetical protein [Vibrio viridaestus]MDC0611509.1 hypothetical protein [Vibrio sp.]RQW63151.1 hypothetical protein EES38_07800 [Vibrio viridaestus]